MDSSETLKAALKEIADTMAAYRPPELAPGRIVGDIMREKAAQRDIFEKAISLATKALQTFPLQSALLVRRARAKRMIVGDQVEFPEIESALDDLYTALELDQDNLEAGLELVDILFSFSSMDDASVAALANDLSEVASRYLCNFRALQIRALGYANRSREAYEVYGRWTLIFPGSVALNSAIESVKSLGPDAKSEE